MPTARTCRTNVRALEARADRILEALDRAEDLTTRLGAQVEGAAAPDPSEPVEQRLARLEGQMVRSAEAVGGAGFLLTRPPSVIGDVPLAQSADSAPSFGREAPAVNVRKTTDERLDAVEGRLKGMVEVMAEVNRIIKLLAGDRPLQDDGT